jgi:hypothetical protein
MAAASDAGETSEEKAAKKEPKPTRTLPTNRIARVKQFEILRAFGAISGPDSRTVSNVEVSKIVNLHSATVGLITPFFVDIGLLQKASDGLVPASEVGEFTQAYEWNPETAFQRVAGVLKRSWFFSVLDTRLRFKPLTKNEAIQELAVFCSAGPSYRGQLETLLEYLDEAGLIAIEGDQLRRPKQSATEGPPEDRRESLHNNQPADARRDESRHSPLTTSFSSSGAGIVQFNVSVKVDMNELSGWEPSRIAAFFAGIAQVLAAKGQAEKQTTGM